MKYGRRRRRRHHAGTILQALAKCHTWRNCCLLIFTRRFTAAFRGAFTGEAHFTTNQAFRRT